MESCSLSLLTRKIQVKSTMGFNIEASNLRTYVSLQYVCNVLGKKMDKWSFYILLLEYRIKRTTLEILLSIFY